MKIGKALLGLAIPVLSSGFISAGENESAKASSGERFLEASQSESLRRGQVSTVAAGSSQNKMPALAVANAVQTVARPELPVPAGNLDKPASTQQIIGAALQGAATGAILGVMFAGWYGMVVGGLIGAALGAGLKMQ